MTIGILYRNLQSFGFERFPGSQEPEMIDHKALDKIWDSPIDVWWNLGFWLMSMEGCFKAPPISKIQFSRTATRDNVLFTFECLIFKQRFDIYGLMVTTPKNKVIVSEHQDKVRFNPTDKLRLEHSFFRER